MILLIVVWFFVVLLPPAFIGVGASPFVRNFRFGKQRRCFAVSTPMFCRPYTDVLTVLRRIPQSALCSISWCKGTALSAGRGELWRTLANVVHSCAFSCIFFVSFSCIFQDFFVTLHLKSARTGYARHSQNLVLLCSRWHSPCYRNILNFRKYAKSLIFSHLRREIHQICTNQTELF